MGGAGLEPAVSGAGNNNAPAKKTTGEIWFTNTSLGDVFTWTVHDVAEPGVGKDCFTYVYSGGSIDLPVITAGNIQVNA